MTTVFDDARSYLSAQLGGVDMSAFADDIIRDNVDKVYPDGWHAFQRDYARFHTAQQKVMESLSPVKQKILVEHMTGRRVKEYDEIVTVDQSDLSVKIVVKYATVEYGSRRDKVTAYSTVLYVFSRTEVGAPWSKDTLDIDEAANEGHIKFGTVNTPERHEAIREQVETCYRPGTDRTPLSGWVARAELSHEQAHADETFQKPSK